MYDMTEKDVLGDALATQKTATGNYNRYANECADDHLKSVMMKVLEQEHGIQKNVFDMMHERGFYSTPQAEESKVEKTRQKYAQCVKRI